MQNNTVTIDLEEYNKLRDFKKGIEDGEVCSIISYGLFSNKIEKWKFYNAERLDKIIVEENKNLSISVIRERNKTQELRNKLNNKSTKLVEEIKKMSICQFIKWKTSE